MKIGIFADPEAVADVAATLVITAMARTENRSLGVSTGSTPLPLYARLREAHARGEFTLEGVRAYSLDEYVGLPVEHPQSYRRVLFNELVGEGRTGLREEDLHTPNGHAEDVFAEAARYEESVIDARIKLQILGIGTNGHIGFNEPGTSLSARTHVEVLAKQTRSDNARFFGDDPDAVPELCITQGAGTIMEAKKLLLLATGATKATAVRAVVEGGISMHWPGSVLQWHDSVVLLADEEAAAELENADLYKERWELTTRRNM